MKVHPRKLAAAWVVWTLMIITLTAALAEPERIIEVEYIVVPAEDVEEPEIEEEPEEVQQFPMETLGVYEVTAYCSCEQCTGPYNDGITYSGEPAVEGITIAADIDKHPIGTELFIEGVGWRTVQDIGGAIKGNRLDLYFEDHDSALEFGRQQLEVYKEAE